MARLIQTDPCRILLWSDAFPPTINGVAVFVAKLTESLIERRYEVGVITGDNDLTASAAGRFGGAQVWRFPFGTVLTSADVDRIQATTREVARIKESFAPDLVQIHSVSPSVLFHLRTRSARKASAVYTLHRMLPEGIGREGVIGEALISSNWITTNSQVVLQDTLRKVPDITERTSVVHPGCDEPTDDPAPLPFDPPRLLCVGRLEEVKGFDIAVRAMSLISTRFPQAKLIIAGDGGARRPLEDLVEEQGLTDVVEFLGWVEPAGVHRVINTSTLVLMPSRWEEPFGLVALEAGAMARPIVATRVGGLPEIVRHDITGLLCDKEDPTALAAAAMQLLSEPHRADEMGRSAREHVRKRFSWRGCLEAYVLLFRRLIDSADPLSG